MRVTATRAFTLVELIIVIVILGILSAFALPKFINLSRKANYAKVAGLFGAFQTAVNLAHAQWIVKGKPTTITMQGSVIPMSANGWPGDSSMSHGKCEALWNGLMHHSEDTSHGDVNSKPFIGTYGGESKCIFNHAQPVTRYMTYYTNTGKITIVNNDV